MGIRFNQSGLVDSTAAGWNAAMSSLGNTAFNLTADLGQTTDRYWAGMFTNGGGTAAGLLCWAAKSNPTVWTIINLPLVRNVCSPLYVYDNDTLFVGAQIAADARIYRYVISTNTFTNMNFPQAGTSDGLSGFMRDPFYPGFLFVGQTANAAGTGGAQLWRLEIATLTWTMVAGNGLGFNYPDNGNRVQVPNLDMGQWQDSLVIGVGTGVTNGLSECWLINGLSAGPPYTFTQIGGDSLNNSWAPGTKRTCAPTVMNGTIYCGIGGASNGDGEVWKRSNATGLWTQIGGDGINGSWAAGTITTAARRMDYLGNKAAICTGGTSAGDAECWQLDLDTEQWTQIAGDSINGTWSGRTSGVATLVDDSNRLLIGAGNNSLNTAVTYRAPASAFDPGSQAGYSLNRLRMPRL